MRMVFHLKVERAKLVTDIDFQNHLHNLEGCECEVTVEQHKNTRSQNQSRYYFGVIVKMLSDELGYTKGETHEILKGKFLSEEVKVGNEIIRYAKSTTDLKTNTFEDLMTDIREWASAELNIFLPLPNEIEL